MTQSCIARFSGKHTPAAPEGLACQQHLQLAYMCSCQEDVPSNHVCRLAKEKAEEHPLVIQELGLPLTSGPWYNASLELTHAGHIASCKLTFHGRQSSSDVLIRVCRPPYVLDLFY